MPPPDPTTETTTTQTAGTFDAHTACARLPVWVVGVGAAALSGAMLGVCHAPLGLGWLAWAAMVPWLLVLQRLQIGGTFLLGVLTALVYYRVGLAWLFGVNGLLAGSAMLIMAIWMGLAFCIARSLMKRCGSAAMLWAVPVALVGQEVLRCEGLPRLRFAFLAFGYSQSHYLGVAQAASWGGVYLLSFIVIAANASIAYALLHRRLRACAPAAVIAVVIALMMIVPGASETSQSRVAVACLQAEELGPRALVSLARRALEHSSRPRVIVLPEHTISDFATPRHPVVQALARLAVEHGAYVCVGSHVRPAHGGACDYDNVGMLIGPDGKIVGQQAKSVPLPFFSDGNPAVAQTVFPTPPLGKMGVLVCYDALFTDIPRRLVDQGAELLLVPVMDAARWPAQERWQHADMAPLRSIELHRAQVRAASSGISQIIDTSGRVIAERTKEEGPGIIWGEVTLSAVRTPFVRVGWTFARVLGLGYLLLIVLLIVADGRDRWKRRRSMKQ